MHGELRKTDIHGIHGNARRSNTAERRSATNVAPVGKMLYRYICLSADFREQRFGHGIGCVLLIGVMLDHYTCIHVRRILLVREFGMVRMHCMRIVAGKQQGGGQQGSQTDTVMGGNSFERIAQQIARRTLLCRTADLFVVKDRTNRNTSGCFFGF